MESFKKEVFNFKFRAFKRSTISNKALFSFFHLLKFDKIPKIHRRYTYYIINDPIHPGCETLFDALNLIPFKII